MGNALLPTCLAQVIHTGLFPTILLNVLNKTKVNSVLLILVCKTSFTTVILHIHPRGRNTLLLLAFYFSLLSSRYRD